MPFSSVTFLFCFLPLTAAIYFLIPGMFANLFLLLASLLFYAWSSPSALWLLLSSILFNWVLGLFLRWLPAGRWRGAVLGVGIGANILSLVYFKYFSFLADSFGPLFHFERILNSAPELPVGISFFTFHAISYLVDIWRNEAEAFGNPVGLGLYIAFFPQLIAGPIAKFKMLGPQIRQRSVSLELRAAGAERFIYGLAKKLLIADAVGAAADHVFALPLGELSTRNAWFGLLAYTLQIYFDFSGYSDMAIGLGRLFGFQLPENFDYPYMSRSIREFWRRWHISLSTWFRDYLYIPLGGNRGSAILVSARLLLVFFTCGLWHGAKAGFILWGLWHGLFLALERGRWGKILERAPALISHLYALAVVMTGWVLFRAGSLSQAQGIYSTLLGFRSGNNYGHGMIIYLSAKTFWPMGFGLLLSTPFFSYLLRLTRSEDSKTTLVSWNYGLRLIAVLALFVVSSSFAASETYHPFLYFQF